MSNIVTLEKRMNYKKIKTIELFAGIGGFRIAADQLGFQTIWANDNNPKSCVVYKDQFGDNELVEGDIQEQVDKVPRHDLLTAGFPCQPFSSAGKKKGIRDSRGTLFQDIVNILRKRTPKFFVLENVKRLLSMEQGSHFATILDALAKLGYQIEWRLLNAINFGLPQNRQRVFIVGIYNPSKNSNISRKWHLGSKEDFGDINLCKYEHFMEFSKWKNIKNHSKKFPDWGVAHNEKFFGFNKGVFSEATPQSTLEATLQSDVDSRFDFTENTKKRINNNRLVNRFVGDVQILSNQNGGARMGYTIFGIKGVAPTLTGSTSRHYERYKIGGKYRMLTNVEYARIQGFSDDHCKNISIYDQYRLYGNAVPSPMVKWVLTKLVFGKGFVPHEPKTLFTGSTF